MKLNHIVIVLIFLCFVVSLSGVSASDDVSMDNVSMVDNEVDLEVSKSIETIDDFYNHLSQIVKIKYDVYDFEDIFDRFRIFYLAGSCS